MKATQHMLWCAAAAFGLGTALSGQTSCTNQFNNQSNFSWTLSGFAGDNTSLMIPPHSTATINWGSSPTQVTVSGQIPNRQYTRKFNVAQAAGGCYTIQHQGNVGNVTLNKPNNGDIVTCTGGC